MNYDKFHLVTVISNPCGYKKRYENYEHFRANLPAWVTLWTVELVTGARRPSIEKVSENHRHITLYQTATEGELWHKEQLVNAGFREVVIHEPSSRYLMYSDSDILWERGSFERIADALQTWPVVQPWSHLINLGPQGQTVSVLKGYVYLKHNPGEAPGPPSYSKIGAPGGAWAFRREMLNRLGCAISGPVLDFAILGSGDNYFAQACYGDIEKSLDPRFHPKYRKWMLLYQKNLTRELKQNVGFVLTTVRHLFHGPYSMRGYDWRNNILIKNNFNPETDLRRDISGLWSLVVQSPRQMKIRDGIREYNRSRNDDRNTM